MDIRDATDADLPALLALNNAEAEAVNALGAAGFEALMRRGFCRLAASEPPTGFLLAFSHATPAQGPNHAWFLGREPAFAYVDRVVVAPAAQGRGLGRALYAALEARARAAGLPALCCEVNLEPPNPGSLRFHERLGFVPAGRATDPRNGKVVQYLMRRLG